MLTKQEIQNAPAVLDPIDTEMWLALIRASSVYRSNAIYYPDLEATLDEASGDTKGKMLNALSKRIQELGVGVAEIRNGDDGLNWFQGRERDSLVAYALSILYPFIDTVILQGNNGAYGNYQVRQRSVYTCCGYCGCSGIHLNWCKYYG